MSTRTLCACAVMLLAASSFAATQNKLQNRPQQNRARETARAKFTSLRQKVEKANLQKDILGARKALLGLHALAPGHSATTYNLACMNALAGRRAEALHWLDMFVRMGQVADAAKDPDLASIAGDKSFLKLMERMKANRAAVERGSTWTTLDGAGLLAEDITYDRKTRSFFVTSLLAKKVLRIDKDKKVSEFADLSKDPGWPVFAVALQSGTNPALWVAAAALPDFSASPNAEWGKTALLKLDMESGRILERFEPAPDGAVRVLGDIAVSDGGTVVVSDGHSGGVYLLNSGERQMKGIDSDEFISPQTPAFDRDALSVFVADYVRGIGRIDLRSGRVTWLTHDDSVATAEIDGLYLHGDQLIAVQNGRGVQRIVSLALNASHTAIKGAEVLAANSEAFADPTHGVLVDDAFYYLSHSGWDGLDRNGNAKAGAALPRPSVRIVNVAEPAAPPRQAVKR
ncbi:MAG TPA: hypothetical protein VN622_11490 [Clostridia bacterium]|nr:hypothetical protein [Clostridia bacterium]